MHVYSLRSVLVQEGTGKSTLQLVDSVLQAKHTNLHKIKLSSTLVTLVAQVL